MYWAVACEGLRIQVSAVHLHYHRAPAIGLMRCIRGVA